MSLLHNIFLLLFFLQFSGKKILSSMVPENPQAGLVTDIIICTSAPLATNVSVESLRFNFNSKSNSKVHGVNVVLFSVVTTINHCIEIFTSNQSAVGESHVLNFLPLYFVFIPSDSKDVNRIIYQLSSIQEKWRKTSRNIWTPFILIIWPDKPRKNSKPEHLIQNTLKSPRTGNNNNNNTFHSPYPNIPVDSKNFIIFLLPQEDKMDDKVDSNQIGVGKAPFFTHKFVSIWEIYHANAHLVTNKVEEFIVSSYKYNYNLGALIQEIITKIIFTGTFVGRRRLYGQPIKAAGVFRQSDLFDLNLERLNETHVKFTGGFSVYILREFSHLLNFTIEEVWGKHYIRNPEIDGIGRQILDGNVDICITLHVVLPYRARHLHFLHPIQPERIRVYFQQPENFALQNIFTFPFSKAVWWTVAFSGVILTISFIIIESTNRRKIKIDEKMPSKLDLIFESTSMFLFQSVTSVSARSVSRKEIVILLGFLQGVVLFSIYSGSIISALTVKLNPVSNFEHLLQYGYLLLAESTVRYHYHAARERSEAKKVIQDTEKHYKDDVDMFRKIMMTSQNSDDMFGDRHFYAMVIESHEFYYKANRLNYTQENVCSVSIMRLQTAKGSGMLIMKGSPYKELLTLKTVLLLERGIVHHHDVRYTENVSPSCQQSSNYKSVLATTLPQVRLRDSSFAFYIIALAFPLAFLILLFEILYVA